MIELNNEAKAAVLNAVFEAELNFVDAVRGNALKEEAGILKAKHVLKETHYRDIYAAQYRLCNRLGLARFYDDWRDEPLIEEGEDESTYTSEQDDAQRDCPSGTATGKAGARSHDAAGV